MVLTRNQTRSLNNPESILFVGRIIVKVPGRRLMYKSTGYCSNYPGTWFPCAGVVKDNPYIENGNGKGFLLKPKSRKNIPRSIKFLCFNSQILERFDTIDNMVISMKIGGGFWGSNDRASVILKDFIKVTDLNGAIGFYKS